MVTHSIVLSGKFHGQRGTWWATVHGAAKRVTHTGMLVATAVITGGNEKVQRAVKSEKRKH